jgi:hypothetical protein
MRAAPVPGPAPRNPEVVVKQVEPWGNDQSIVGQHVAAGETDPLPDRIDGHGLIVNHPHAVLVGERIVTARQVGESDLSGENPVAQRARDKFAVAFHQGHVDVRRPQADVPRRRRAAESAADHHDPRRRQCPGRVPAIAVPAAIRPSA